MRSSVSCSFSAKLGTLVALGARVARSAARRCADEPRVTRAAALVAAGVVSIASAPTLEAQGVNLLSNPGFEEPGDCANGFSTAYLCWPPGDPGRGYYRVGTDPAAWNDLFFHCPQPIDHTPTGSGKMLILDGDTHVDAWTEMVPNLVDNTTYRFRFWVMNLYGANPAVLKVTFRPEPNWNFAQFSPLIPVQNVGCTWQMVESYWTCNPAWWAPNEPRNMTIK